MRSKKKKKMFFEHRDEQSIEISRFDFSFEQFSAEIRNYVLI